MTSEKSNIMEHFAVTTLGIALPIGLFHLCGYIVINVFHFELEGFYDGLSVMYQLGILFWVIIAVFPLGTIVSVTTKQGGDK